MNNGCGDDKKKIGKKRERVVAEINAFGLPFICTTHTFTDTNLPRLAFRGRTGWADA